MDFTQEEDNLVINDLALQIFSDHVSDTYLTTQGGEFDSELWQKCAEAGFIGMTLAADNGGSELEFMALCGVLEALGQYTATVPLLETNIAAHVLAQSRYSMDLAAVISGAAHLSISLNSGLTIRDERVVGSVSAVPFASDAQHIVLSTGDRLLIVNSNTPGLDIQAQQLSSGTPAALIRLDCAASELEWVDDFASTRNQLLTGSAWLMHGILFAALQRTAAYTSERKQFGRPIATFQAVAHRAANAFIDLLALKGCMELAAWKIGRGQNASVEASSAYWWACEAGHRTVHTSQHLHAGMGADLTYPIHRFFLRAKEVEFSMGGAAIPLQQLSSALKVQDHSERRIAC